MPTTDRRGKRREFMVDGLLTLSVRRTSRCRGL